METKTDIELQAVQHCIKIAREYARKHFRANMATNNTLLDPPCFKVDFPDVDLMVVTPMMYGAEIGPPIRYRLRFDHNNGGAVSWHPTELLYGIRKLPDLPVPKPDRIDFGV